MREAAFPEEYDAQTRVRVPPMHGGRDETGY